MSIDLSEFEKAIQSLENSLTPPPANDRERDGSIKRFEYTFELAWKSAKRVLASEGIESLTPKSVIRDLGNQGWIDNVEEWLDFLKARNESTHIYKQQTAVTVFNKAKEFPAHCQKLLNTLKAHNQ